MTVSPESHASRTESWTAPASKLTGRLGVGQIVFMVVAAAAPLTCIVGILPLVLLYADNVAAPLYFVASGLILVLFSFGYTRMSKYIENAGAFYTYIRAGLGRFAGAGASTLALGSYMLVQIAVFPYVGVFASQIIGNFTGWKDSPWWLWAAVLIAIAGFLGYRNIDLSAKVLGVMLIAETILVLVLDVAILVQGGDHGISAASLSPSTAFSGAPGLGLMFAFLCFLGFEATAVFRSEAKEPERTIPRATFLAVILVGVVYAFSAWALINGIGTSNALASITKDPTGIIFDLGTSYVGPVFADIMQVLLLSSFFAAALSFHNVVNRYQVSLSDAGILPRVFGKINDKHRAPSVASLVTTGITAIVLAITVAFHLDPVLQIYAPLSGCLGFGVLILMGLTCIAVIVYFHTKGRTGPIWTTTVAPGIAFIGLAAIFGLALSNIDLLTGSRGSSILVEGLLIFFIVAGIVAAGVLQSRRESRSTMPSAAVAIQDQ